MSKTTILYKDIAPGAAERAEFASDYAIDFSDLDDLRRETEEQRIATGELNEWILDGSFSIRDGDSVPYWSDELSDVDCVFENPPSVVITFPAQYSVIGLTLIFDEATSVYCTEVNIKWYQQEALRADADFFPDGYEYFCAEKVESFDKIVITFKKTNLPYRYAKLKQVIFGRLRLFDMTEIRNARTTNQMNHITAELPVSTMNWTLDSNDEIGFMFQLKQPMEVRSGDELIGVYYISEHKRKTSRVYDLNCQDALGVLDGDTFGGGVYNAYSAKQLVRDIVGSDFDVDFGTVKDTELTGILQTMTKREALQQVLFAWGVCAATDGGEVIRIFDLQYEPEEIGIGRTYTGTTLETSAMVTAVRVTAHTYTQDANGSVEVNGVKYTDTTTVYTVTNPNVTANDKQNVVEVTGATLVSPSIGQETARRVYDYYARRTKANTKIVWRGERLGDAVTVPNAWGETSTGNIDRMEIVLSNTVAANCEVIA